MNLYKELQEMFDFFEPVLWTVSLVIQITIFFMLVRRRMKREALTSDIINHGLEKLKFFLAKSTEKNTDKKNQIEPKKGDIK